MSQVVLILVGLIGSGKSTFAQALEHHLPASFRRCNQDDLGDRRSVEALARQALGLGLSVCIDRTNFDAQQRAHWIRIARDYSVPVWVLVFDTPVQVCSERLRTRVGHPTIKDFEQASEVLSQFYSQFQYPRLNEGYDNILYLKPSDHLSPHWSLDEVATILSRLEKSTSRDWRTSDEGAPVMDRS
ncbi:P-loop containing nucleoside triphosphate hydrolase protein [Thelephora ganbajun]|uniref:P-loop containing nucleoside triphosphate hydrolase protein n=1 Tax=Thelephora ganbajun TaxID=370292 RepID=A0ACB6ZIC5_THEGA|nr:P-loop containing nucleoside triphosphate hydrolase protein [Thelephora ganbajun]